MAKRFPTTIDDVEHFADRPTRRSLMIMFVVTVLIAVVVPIALFPPAIREAGEFDKLAVPAHREVVQGEVVDVIGTEYGRNYETVRIELTDGSKVSYDCPSRSRCFGEKEPVTVIRSREHPSTFYFTSNLTGQSTLDHIRHLKIRTATAWTVLALVPLLIALFIISHEYRLRARILKIETEAYGVVDRRP